MIESRTATRGEICGLSYKAASVITCLISSVGVASLITISIIIFLIVELDPGDSSDDNVDDTDCANCKRSLASSVFSTRFSPGESLSCSGPDQVVVAKLRVNQGISINKPGISTNHSLAINHENSITKDDADTLLFSMLCSEKVAAERTLCEESVANGLAGASEEAIVNLLTSLKRTIANHGKKQSGLSYRLPGFLTPLLVEDFPEKPGRLYLQSDGVVCAGHDDSE